MYKYQEYAKIYKLKHPEKVRLWNANYRQKHLSEIRGSDAQYYKDNAERLKKKNNEYYHSNKIEISKRRKLYKIDMKEQVARTRRYRNTPIGKMKSKVWANKRKRGLETLSLDIVQQVYEENIKKFGTLTCELCIEQIKFGDDSLEHFHPVSRRDEYDGDINERKNLGVAHRKCNFKKCDKTLQEFRRV